MAFLWHDKKLDMVVLITSAIKIGGNLGERESHKNFKPN